MGSLIQFSDQSLPEATRGGLYQRGDVVPQIDLTAYDRKPFNIVYIPQPHGLLRALDVHTLVIVQEGRSAMNITRSPRVRQLACFSSRSVGIDISTRKPSASQ